MLPYAINSNVTAKKRSAPEDDEAMEEEDNEEENDDINFDRMIKVTLKFIFNTLVVREYSGNTHTQTETLAYMY